MLQALDGDLTRLYSDKALPLKVENVLLLQLLHLDQLLLERQLFAAQLLLLKREKVRNVLKYQRDGKREKERERE